MSKYLIIISILILSGCNENKIKETHDFFKAIEGKAYNAAAKSVSEYCKKAGELSIILDQERLEARREIRQRGNHGPLGPDFDVNGLDEKTMHGPGPVVRVWCEGETVPEVIWKDFIR